VADQLLQKKVVIDAQASELVSRGKKMQEITILIECAICTKMLSKDTVCNNNQILCFAVRLVQQALTILVSRAALQSLHKSSSLRPWKTLVYLLAHQLQPCLA